MRVRTQVPRTPAVSLVHCCSGISAVWCPTHGDCTCPRTDDGDFERMDADDCPLHSRHSRHPVRTRVATCYGDALCDDPACRICAAIRDEESERKMEPSNEPTVRP